jgi:hypothetical protein
MLRPRIETISVKIIVYDFPDHWTLHRFAMKLLFLFMDGVGLGAPDPMKNPFAAARLPVLADLLGGQMLVRAAAPYEGERLSLVALDASLGVAGLPQSATGQAVLLTGTNIPAEIGYHYGPKPNQAVAAYLKNGNLFSQLKSNGRKIAFLNAYPPRYFEYIRNGRRMYSAVPLAATSAGLSLKTSADLNAGAALAADFTAQGWHEHLNLRDTPLLDPRQAGIQLGRLATEHDFSFFEFWLSDYAGHQQDMAQAIHLLTEFDQVLGGLLEAWDDQAGLILITSDHGNLEDLSTRRHTDNPVPGITIGSQELRRRFNQGLVSLIDVSPAIQDLLNSAG